MHINTDLLDACHLISAMLIEVPAIAAEKPDQKRFIRSRYFRKHYDNMSRQVFTGPPEHTRDFVIHAAKRLMMGDWKGCHDFIAGLDVFKLFPGHASNSISAMLENKIKVEQEI